MRCRFPRAMLYPSLARVRTNALMLYPTRAISGAISSFSQPRSVGGRDMWRSQISSELVLCVQAFDVRCAGTLKMNGNVYVVPAERIRVVGYSDSSMGISKRRNRWVVMCVISGPSLLVSLIPSSEISI